MAAPGGDENRGKFITDYEVMEEKIPDSELLGEITERHKAAFRQYPEAVTADVGFRAVPEEMSQVHQHVATVAVPGRNRRAISVLKRAFRLSICMYRGFKSFAAAVGMAVFCHNLVNLLPK
jgi:hypothetical protein